MKPEPSTSSAVPQVGSGVPPDLPPPSAVPQVGSGVPPDLPPPSAVPQVGSGVPPDLPPPSAVPQVGSGVPPDLPPPSAVLLTDPPSFLVVLQDGPPSPRIVASLLRLHFHDCFVQGCDASVLLDDSGTIASEKNSLPNKNSLKGFEIIDSIKAKLEEAFPQTVSCADILAMAARGSTVLSGEPNWELPLGRRVSRRATLKDSNKNIPPPNSTLQNLITLFNRQGLNEVDLVTLSGGHTIRVARCATFKQRLYNNNKNEEPDVTLERSYYMGLKSVCPLSGGDNNISPLDIGSPARFDNTYFKLILWGKGLLTSDEVLFTMELVKSYAEDGGLFFNQFAKSMVKMGNITPLTGINGEVRRNCHHLN